MSVRRNISAPFQLKKPNETVNENAQKPGGIFVDMINYRTFTFPPLEKVADLKFEKYCGPTPESNWVIPNIVLVGAYPASDDDVETFDLITSILKHGIQKFVCLQSEYQAGVSPSVWRKGQALRPYFEDVQRIVQNKNSIVEFEGCNNIVDMNGLSFDHCPIVDCGVTDDSKVLALAIKLVKDISQGQRIYLHCWGGHGRTGTVVCIMLHLLYGMTANQAFEYCQAVHDLRTCPVQVGSPQTPTQRQQVIRVIAHLAQLDLENQERIKVAARLKDDELALKQFHEALQRKQDEEDALRKKEKDALERKKQLENSAVALNGIKKAVASDDLSSMVDSVTPSTAQKASTAQPVIVKDVVTENVFVQINTANPGGMLAHAISNANREVQSSNLPAINTIPTGSRKTPPLVTFSQGSAASSASNSPAQNSSGSPLLQTLQAHPPKHSGATLTAPRKYVRNTTSAMVSSLHAHSSGSSSLQGTEEGESSGGSSGYNTPPPALAGEILDGVLYIPHSSSSGTNSTTSLNGHVPHIDLAHFPLEGEEPTAVLRNKSKSRDTADTTLEEYEETSNDASAAAADQRKDSPVSGALSESMAHSATFSVHPAKKHQTLRINTFQDNTILTHISNGSMMVSTPGPGTSHSLSVSVSSFNDSFKSYSSDSVGRTPMSVVREDSPFTCSQADTSDNPTSPTDTMELCTPLSGPPLRGTPSNRMQMDGADDASTGSRDRTSRNSSSANTTLPSTSLNTPAGVASNINSIFPKRGPDGNLIITQNTDTAMDVASQDGVEESRSAEEVPGTNTPSNKKNRLPGSKFISKTWKMFTGATNTTSSPTAIAAGVKTRSSSDVGNAARPGSANLDAASVDSHGSAVDNRAMSTDRGAGAENEFTLPAATQVRTSSGLKSHSAESSQVNLADRPFLSKGMVSFDSSKTISSAFSGATTHASTTCSEGESTPCAPSASQGKAPVMMEPTPPKHQPQGGSGNSARRVQLSTATVSKN